MIKVFISSACYELRDLRAALRSWLEERGFSVCMSDECGFPHRDGIQPYASCIPALEDCQLIVAIVDREYGVKFSEWDPYTHLNGCSPTHGEIKHALAKKKRTLIYIQNDVMSFYEVWRKNKGNTDIQMPKGLSTERPF